MPNYANLLSDLVLVRKLLPDKRQKEYLNQLEKLANKCATEIEQVKAENDQYGQELQKAQQERSDCEDRLKQQEARANKCAAEIEQVKSEKDQYRQELQTVKQERSTYEQRWKRWKRFGMAVSALFIVGTIIALAYLVFGQPPPKASIPCTSLAIEGFMIAGQPVAPGSSYEASVNLDEVDVVVEAKVKTEPSDCDFDTKWQVTDDENGEYLPGAENMLTVDLPIPPTGQKSYSKLHNSRHYLKT